MKTLDIRPVTEQELTPEEFLKLMKNNRSAVKSSKIVAPRLGEQGFGKIRVVRKFNLNIP